MRAAVVTANDAANMQPMIAMVRASGMRIALTDDLLRCPENQLEAHPANRATLLAAVLPALRRTEARIEEVSCDAAADYRTSAAELMSALRLPAGRLGWARAWDAQPTPAFIRKIGQIFSPFDVIVGWGLSNIMLRAFELCGFSYFDVELSPYRFAENFYFTVRTNVPALSAIARAHTIRAATLAAIAGEVSAYHNRRNREFLVRKDARCGVIFGQSPLDAALIHEGRLAAIDQFLEDIRAWSAQVDHLFYKEHPHGDGSTLRWLKSHFDVETLRRPPYQILSANDLHCVAAISSGICMEAEAFGIPAATFGTNLRYAYLSTAQNYLSCPAVDGASLNHALAGLIGVEAPGAEFAPDYRKIFSSAWGERFARDEPASERHWSSEAGVRARTALPELAVETIRRWRERWATYSRSPG